MPGASGPGRADRRRRLAGATVVALVASLAMTVAALPASAQARRDSIGSISGTVVSSVNGEVLPRAQVSITGTTRGTITDDAAERRGACLGGMVRRGSCEPSPPRRCRRAVPTPCARGRRFMTKAWRPTSAG